MRLPDDLLVHEVVVEPHLGTSGHGPAYGAAVTHPAFIDRTHRLIRTPQGDLVTSSGTAYLQLDAGVSVEDRLTIAGRAAVVLAVLWREFDESTPNHLEVQLQ